jgi:hypothetical protein
MVSSLFLPEIEWGDVVMLFKELTEVGGIGEI